MILDSLRNSASFNETDRAIATYLLNHTGDLKTLTMAKLAQETYTSNATIIRFCKKLGLSGYREQPCKSPEGRHRSNENRAR